MTDMCRKEVATCHSSAMTKLSVIRLMMMMLGLGLVAVAVVVLVVVAAVVAVVARRQR